MAFGTRRIIETPFCRWTLCDVGLIFFPRSQSDEYFGATARLARGLPTLLRNAVKTAVATPLLVVGGSSDDVIHDVTEDAPGLDIFSSNDSLH